MAYFKDDAALQTLALAPARPAAAAPGAGAELRALVATYNRLGGLMEALAAKLEVKTAAVLALWAVESSGKPQTPGAATLRLECHLLFENWGKQHAAEFDARFRFGGQAGQAGRAWENHQFRAVDADAWAPLHTGQANEYRAMETARALAGDEAALSSASIGGPQIVMNNAALIGYASARAMWDAFQQGERAQVLGFFDFCAHKRAPREGDLLGYLKARDWRQFARYYNGPGKAEEYGAKIAAQFARWPEA
jgi:hypothetical protein